jgi:hypothetical protein
MTPGVSRMLESSVELSSSEKMEGLRSMEDSVDEGRWKSMWWELEKESMAGSGSM